MALTLFAIRKEFGNEFFLGVGGYPDSHQEQSDIDVDISYLKEKVDAGSDIVVTQLFYDVDKFLAFRDKCSTIGIHVPIIPGIMPIHNYARFIKFTQFCKISIPKSVTETIESIKNDDSSVMNYGIDQATSMCEKLIAEENDFNWDRRTNLPRNLSKHGEKNLGEHTCFFYTTIGINGFARPNHFRLIC